MNNDIVTKARLNAALGTEGNMGFEHNDIVTVDKMNEAIAEGGGGGGGDLTTAEVTIVLTGIAPSFPANVPILVDYVDPEYPEDNFSSTDVSSSLEAGTYTVPLYKDGCRLKLNNDGNGTVTASGNAEVIAGVISSVIITGDCTLTYNL